MQLAGVLLHHGPHLVFFVSSVGGKVGHTIAAVPQQQSNPLVNDYDNAEVDVHCCRCCLYGTDRHQKHSSSSSIWSHSG